MSNRETSAEIDEAAAHWATRLDASMLSDDEQAAFDHWLEGDLRRVGAFARAQAVLVQVRRAKALGSEFDPASFAAEPPIEEKPAPVRLTRRRMLMGASAVAATGAFAFFLPATRASATIYATGRGEIRLVPLPDGSTVTLNTDSRIAVTIDANNRAIQLLRGEALFKVVRAQRPPFAVRVGDLSLRATNATFTVCQLDKQPLQLGVCEGEVEVAQRGLLMTRNARTVPANTQSVISPDGSFTDRKIAPEAQQRALSWQEGMLAFEDTPLAQAAEAFARYSDRRIRIPDAAVGAETVTGLYAANNPEGFAQAVALSLNLHMQKTPGGILIVR